jgi:hypothetical protein
MNIELHNLISCRSELLVISTDTVAVSSGVIVDLCTLQLWLNDLGERCQCCAQGKRCGQAPTEVFEGAKAPRRGT